MYGIAYCLRLSQFPAHTRSNFMSASVPISCLRPSVPISCTHPNCLPARVRPNGNHSRPRPLRAPSLDFPRFSLELTQAHFYGNLCSSGRSAAYMYDALPCNDSQSDEAIKNGRKAPLVIWILPKRRICFGQPTGIGPAQVIRVCSRPNGLPARCRPNFAPPAPPP